MIETIINSEAFLIVISGVLIFALQNLISQLWISPAIDFRKCLSKIETSLARWSFLHRFEYKKNNLASAEGTMDQVIENFKKEISNLVTELIGSYNLLPAPEKWYLNIKGVDINKAKQSLLALSVLVASKGDWNTGDSKAKGEMNKIYTYLKFKKYFTEI